MGKGRGANAKKRMGGANAESGNGNYINDRGGLK